MKCTLMGIRDLDFKSGRDDIQGTSLFFAYEADGVTGYETAKAFISPEKRLSNLEDYVGTEVNIDFNVKGKVVSVDIA